MVKALVESDEGGVFSAQEIHVNDEKKTLRWNKLSSTDIDFITANRNDKTSRHFLVSCMSLTLTQIKYFP